MSNELAERLEAIAEKLESPTHPEPIDPKAVYRTRDMTVFAEAASLARQASAALRSRDLKDFTGLEARALCDALGFDPTNHHNALKCPYCNPDQLVFAASPDTPGDGGEVELPREAVWFVQRLERTQVGDWSNYQEAEAKLRQLLALSVPLEGDGEVERLTRDNAIWSQTAHAEADCRIAAEHARDEAIAERDRLVADVRPLVDAAKGLSFGEDWNLGTAAKSHGYRRKLLAALPRAVAALSSDTPLSGGGR